MTRLDRWEPELNIVAPGEELDTTTPAAIGNAYRSTVLGDVLGPAERARLKEWLLATVTGDARIRAGLPSTWVTGDKTGTGYSGAAKDVNGDNALLAEAARVVAGSFRPY